MGKTFESYIDLSGPLNIVSIALNGLLKINGPLTQVRNHYHIDVKKEIKGSQDTEIQIMYSNFFQHVKHMDIRLMELNPYQTRMTYVIEKNVMTVALIFLIIFDLLLSLLIGFCFSQIGESFTAQILLFSVSYAIFFLIFGIAPLIFIFAKTDASLKKRFENYFIERLASYMTIVQKNQYRQ
ncbi:MAG: hypothetical protein IIX48_02230 [Lachnospiraceae bacterium]|nr:hypothetical protein [Lachnospiraceae bacterium]